MERKEAYVLRACPLVSFAGSLLISVRCRGWVLAGLVNRPVFVIGYGLVFLEQTDEEFMGNSRYFPGKMLRLASSSAQFKIHAK